MLSVLTDLITAFNRDLRHKWYKFRSLHYILTTSTACKMLVNSYNQI